MSRAALARTVNMNQLKAVYMATGSRSTAPKRASDRQKRYLRYNIHTTHRSNNFIVFKSLYLPVLKIIDQINGVLVSTTHGVSFFMLQAFNSIDKMFPIRVHFC
jgi:hypothetical protein